MVQNELIRSLNRQMSSHFKEDLTAKELSEKLVAFVNELILHDFEKLVSLLYRIDIDEDKLKKILKASPGTDTAEIIAGMVLEREKQKAEMRSKYRS